MVVVGSRRVVWAALIAFVLHLEAGQSWASDAPKSAISERVAVVRVHLPLRGNADQILQAMLGRTCDQLLAKARQRKDSRRPLLVLEFETHGAEASAGPGSQFERAYALASFLCSRQMAGVKTIAYLPRSIRGHATLLPLACEEIVMAPDAYLGEAAIDEMDRGALRQTTIAAYREIADMRRTVPVSMAVGMIDASAKVVQVETEAGIDFVLGEELEALVAGREIIEQRVLFPPGTMAQFDGREGRQFGFVKYLASDRQELATALGVSIDALVETDALAADWRPIMIDLQGEITSRKVNQLENMLRSALDRRHNWIGLRIDSAGGDLAASVRLATTLAQLDPNSVRTVAYVPSEAHGGAAIVALACDQLVMHSEARLNAGAQSKSSEEAVQNDLAAAHSAIRGVLSTSANHSWSLFAAMIDPSIRLFEYHNKQTGATRLMSEQETTDRPDAADWKRRDPVAPENQSLTIDGQQAAQWGIARAAVESFDQLKQQYDLPENPPVAKPNLALEFVEALASSEFAVILLIAGFAGIYAELRTPGLGIGAFVGAVSLVLFFWSQYLNGTAGWLEVLLFLSGLGFILLEIFVVPGFGIFGLGGGALVFASIVLASLTFVRPQSESEVEQLARSVGMVAFAVAGVMALAVVSHRYLPKAPLFRRLILAPPEADEREQLDERELLADYSAMVGAIGVATTDLRPAGKAQIDQEFVDVIAEGEPIDRGALLVVVEARANRVVVRQTGAAKN